MGPVNVKVVAAGVTELEAPEAALVPTALAAVTVQVTAVPGVSPVTAIGLTDPVPVLLPQVAVYPVIAVPPVAAGAVNVTVAEPLPAVAAPMVGAAGGVL